MKGDRTQILDKYNFWKGFGDMWISQEVSAKAQFLKEFTL